MTLFEQIVWKIAGAFSLNVKLLFSTMNGGSAEMVSGLSAKFTFRYHSYKLIAYYINPQTLKNGFEKKIFSLYDPNFFDLVKDYIDECHRKHFYA